MHYECCMRTPEATSPDDLLTTREVAERARVSTVTVTRWAKQGRLQGVRISERVLRFRRGDVDALLSSPIAEDGAA